MAVDDLHLDGIGFCAANKLCAAKTQVMIDRNLHAVAIAVGSSGDGNRNEYYVIPFRMCSFPGFLRQTTGTWR